MVEICICSNDIMYINIINFEIYGKYIVINDFQVQQKKYEAQYNQYIKRVNQQREEFKEFFLNF